MSRPGKMRVLFVVLSPLDPRLGASQMALNLAQALHDQGQDVTVWTPHPPPADLPWWRHMSWMRARTVEHMDEAGPFDVVDLPPVAVSAALAGRCRVVARDVQPDLQYLWCEVRHARIAGRPLRWGAAMAFNAYLGALVVAGWFHARWILCLGRANHAWLRRWLPWWSGKAHPYPNAIGDPERRELERIRHNRRAVPGAGVRWLWLGRWVSHKGNDVLIEFIARQAHDRPADSFTIAGCGPRAADDVPAGLLAGGRVTIVESYDRAGLLRLLESHDAGLFTSRSEGWGLTLQEMLESGMPVYATPAGAACDLAAIFPDQLRSFPPPDAGRPIVVGLDPPESYFETHSWRAIANAYRERILESRG